MKRKQKEEENKILSPIIHANDFNAFIFIKYHFILLNIFAKHQRDDLHAAVKP